jgi:predicted DCC family thiol-disulfide oxidoreductase YuxK
MEAGFRFRFANLEAALAELHARPDAAAAPLVLMNEACPVCRGELSHYQRLADRRRAVLCVRRIADDRDALRDYGLGEWDIRHRLHAIRKDGRVVSGVDAVIGVWRGLPGYRHLATLFALPGLYHFAALIYDGMLVPILGKWNVPRRESAETIRESG